MTAKEIAKLYPPIKELVEKETKKALPDAKFSVSSYPASGILIVKVKIKNWTDLIEYEEDTDHYLGDDPYDNVKDSSTFDEAQINIEDKAVSLFKKLSKNNPYGRVVVDFVNPVGSDLFNLDGSAN